MLCAADKKGARQRAGARGKPEPSPGLGLGLAGDGLSTPRVPHKHTTGALNWVHGSPVSGRSWLSLDSSTQTCRYPSQSQAGSLGW